MGSIGWRLGFICNLNGCNLDRVGAKKTLDIVLRSRNGEMLKLFVNTLVFL
jgi:hypothetical protein